MVLIQPTYFAPIIQYALIYGEKKIQFEFEDNYQKQTYRNRCYIAGPNGKQLLNIPIKHDKTKSKTLTKNIEIDYSSPIWYKNHIKSLQAAYRSSPFFEYYEADLISIFEKEHKLLLDLNIELHEFILDAIQETTSFTKTIEYTSNSNDFRSYSNAKSKVDIDFPVYTQMFHTKHGFLPNLSILDLLFMEGPASYKYLEKLQFMLK